MFRVIPLALIILIAIIAWSLWRRERRRRTMIRATNEFVRDRLVLEHDFCAAANVTGKPRGLRWARCQFQTGLVLARDRATAELFGLVPATISFEAIPGGGMEEVEAVGNLRAATAIFIWTADRWTTTGHAVFNLEPQEVLAHYAKNLEPVATV